VHGVCGPPCRRWGAHGAPRNRMHAQTARHTPLLGQDTRSSAFISRAVHLSPSMNVSVLHVGPRSRL